MNSGAKSSLSLQKSQPKLFKPSKFAFSSTWNPNVPKSHASSLANSSSLVDDEKNDEILWRLRNEDVFDEIIDKIINFPIEQAIEGPLHNLFNSSLCIFWIDNPTEKTLYSPTHSLTVGISNSIVGYTRLSRGVIQIQNQTQCPPNFIINNIMNIPSDSKHLFFPVLSADSVHGVVQIIKFPEFPEFSDADLDSVTFIMKKFSLIGNSIFNTSRLCNLSMTLFQKEKSSIDILSIAQNYFQCRAAELWKYDSNLNEFYFFDRQTNLLNLIESTDCGIVGQCLIKNSVVNERMASSNPSFSATFDGAFEGPILVVPYEKTRREIWALALRGRGRSFNVYDEREVMSIMPFIVRAAMNASSEKDDVASSLRMLLDIASKLNSSLNLSELIDVVLEKSTQLIECEKSAFLFFDDKKEFFLNQKDPSMKVPSDKGIAGQSSKEKKILNFLNPQNEANFCKEVDCCIPDLELLSSLTVPLLSLHDEVVGVLILYNKNDGEKFNENDEKLIAALNVFAGIAFENAKLYQVSFDLSSALIKLSDDSNGETIDVRTVFSSLLTKALEVTFCDRITLFMRKKIDEYETLINVGCESRCGITFAKESADKRAPLLSPIKSNSQQKSENCVKDRSNIKMNGNSSMSLISNLLVSKPSPNTKNAMSDDEPEEMVYDVPVMNGDLAIVGVIEYHFYNSRSDIIFEFFKSFGSLFEPYFSSFTKVESSEVNIDDWISKKDFDSTKVPSKLQLDGNKSALLYSLQFDISKYEGIELFQIVFSVFSKLGLMSSFEISNSQLFNFLNGIREKYQKVPFADWKHAVDTFQFLTYEISSGRIERFLSKDKILAMLIAALCHDCGHECFEDEQNLSMSESALLSRNCSFKEVQNCLSALSVISDEKFNPLNKTKQEQSKSIWENVIDLILCTDMSLHFVILKEFEDLVKVGEFDPADSNKHKALLMKVLIKCADHGSLARPFDVAKLSFNYVSEEFYREGDIERAVGLVFEPEKNERENIIREQSLVGFMKSVVLPLFQTLGKQISLLSSSADQIKENISKYQACLDSTK